MARRRNIQWCLLLGGLGMLLLQTRLSESQGDSQMGMLAQVSPAISLSISGGINARGRRTVLSGQSIVFGNVIYTQPDLIGNGDAFLDNQQHLQIEATLNIGVVSGGGVPKVGVQLSRLPGSPNPFAEVRYATGLRREDPTQAISTFPEQVTLGELPQGGGSMALRVLGVITPSQSGTFSETVRIYATPTI